MAILFSTWVKIGKEAGPGLERNIKNLLANSSSALRVECLEENGAEVFYIRDRNIFDYLWEKLDAYESQLREMRKRARVALEQEIRPFIQEEALQEADSLPLWKKIEKRILDDNSLNEKTPFFHNISGCLLVAQKTVDQLSSIPDGLSLAPLPPSAFIAGVAFGLDKGEGLKSDKPMHVGYSKGPMIEWPTFANYQEPNALQIKHFYLTALRNLSTENLPKFSSMVITPTPHPLEKNGKLSHEHANGFLAAAKEFINERKRSKAPVSLLIAAEKPAWYKELEKELLGIGGSLHTSENNAAPYNQRDVSESPSGFSKMVSEWRERYGSPTREARNLDFSDNSDDETIGVNSRKPN